MDTAHEARYRVANLSKNIYTQVAYNAMRAVFVELPAFARNRESYLGDVEFRRLQETLMAHPAAGDVIEGTGGLRKLRFADLRRGKGRRGGLRIIYFWWEAGLQFWLFTLFDKDEASDLSPEHRKALRARMKAELEVRRSS